MRTLNWEDILNEAAEKKINFIAEAMTPLHVLGVEVLILYLQSKGIELKGYILSIPHAKTGKGLVESMFHTDCYRNIEPVIFDGITTNKKGVIRFYRRLGKRLMKGEPFYYASPLKPAFDRIYQIYERLGDANLYAYVTEEGTGNYVLSPYSEKRYHSEIRNPYRYIRAIWHGVIKERILDWYLEKAGCLNRFLLLNVTDGHAIPNYECAKAYEKLLKSEKPNVDLSNYEDSVIIAPSLLYESGIVSKRIDICVYEKIQDILGDECKYTLKPHPREKDLESYKSLKFSLETENRYSIESIIANLNRPPRYVIGDVGTALVNLAVIFGVKTISINKLMDKKFLNDKSYFDVYNRMFGDIVFIPENEKELAEYLGEK